jgi:hypothetical protein
VPDGVDCRQGGIYVHMSIALGCADLSVAEQFADDWQSKATVHADGNKRVALVIAELFLALNGFDLTADDANCVTSVLQLADGSLTEKAFGAWLWGHITKTQD